MKKRTVITTTIIMIMTFSGCKDAVQKIFPAGQTTAISVLQDQTDPELLKAAPAEVLGLFKINDGQLYNGYIFRERAISDVNLKRVRQAQVQPAVWFTSDDNERVAQLKSFRAEVTSAINESDKEIGNSKQHSLVYEAICGELNNLNATKAQNKCLVIYSDLLENSEFSFYKPSSLQLARANPKAVAAQFQRKAPLPRIDGIKIYVVYQPQSFEAQRQFDAALNVFKLMLEQQGGQVIVVANVVNS